MIFDPFLFPSIISKVQHLRPISHQNSNRCLSIFFFSMFFQRRRLKREISFLFRRITLENFKSLRSNFSTMIFDLFPFFPFQLYPKYNRPSTISHQNSNYCSSIFLSSIFFQTRKLKREISFLFRRITLENFKSLRSNSSTMIFDPFLFFHFNYIQSIT